VEGFLKVPLVKELHSGKRNAATTVAQERISIVCEKHKSASAGGPCQQGRKKIVKSGLMSHFFTFEEERKHRGARPQRRARRRPLFAKKRHVRSGKGDNLWDKKDTTQEEIAWRAPEDRREKRRGTC